MVLGNTTGGGIIHIDIPKIDKILARVKDSKYFTSIDLRGGYYYIILSPETRLKGAFTILFGKYEFQRKSFSLAQGAADFTSVLQRFLRIFSDFCSFYMSDVFGA